MRSSSWRVLFALAVPCGLLGLLPSRGASQTTPIRVSPRDPVLTATPQAQPRSLCQTFTASTVDQNGAVTGVAQAVWIAANGAEFWADSLTGTVCLKAAPAAAGSRTSVIAYAIGSGATDSTTFSVMPAPSRIITGQNPTVFRGTRPTREPMTAAPTAVISRIPGNISGEIARLPAGPPPTDVKVSSGSPVSATVSWSIVQGASSYSVSRGGSLQGPFSVVAPSIATAAFPDRGLTPNTTYYWVVAANYPRFSPGSSAAVAGTTLAPRNPSNFTATSGKAEDVTFKWSAQTDADHYVLQGNGLTARQVTGTTFTETGLSPGIRTYSLIAYYVSGGQTFSDAANPSTTRAAALPKHFPWLAKRNGVGSPAETDAYYTAIGALPAKNTFTKWKLANGFPANEVRARYFNAQDLNLGRDNHCRASASGLACYQSNSGPPPNSPDFPNATAALADIVNGAPPFATVAMDISPSGRVNFYAFNNATDSIVVAADLDTDGKKAIPQACTACHGGTYDVATHTMSNASFLPFDVFGFQFASATGFRLADQQEIFRKLNSLVKASQPNLTNPHNPIVTFIDGAYGGGVDVAGSTPSDSWVPAGWTAKPNVYDVFKRTCRTCHLAVVDSARDFTSYAQLKSQIVPVQVDMCTSHSMPHAEVPYRKFWLNLNVYLPGYWQDPSVLGITCP